jgi:hypothetical protein
VAHGQWGTQPPTEMSDCQRCGHSEEQHSELLGFCGVLGCQCVAMVEDDGWEDEDNGDVPELDFDEDG